MALTKLGAGGRSQEARNKAKKPGQASKKCRPRSWKSQQAGRREAENKNNTKQETLKTTLLAAMDACAREEKGFESKTDFEMLRRHSQ